MKNLLIALTLVAPSLHAWELGPFMRADEVNPIITSRKESLFHCPIRQESVAWEANHTFNPAAVVRDDKVYLLYRAEDLDGEGIGGHTSRLGLATSEDGLHFARHDEPIFYPDWDDQLFYEWAGGCEDPRIVETDQGSYVMTYTQWDNEVALLAVAISFDLVHWKKHGYVFSKANRCQFGRRWSKSGSIVCRQVGDHLIATKVNGKYWMYWGEGQVYIAHSDNLIHWEPVLNHEGIPVAVLPPRYGKFDSNLTEAGPPAVITDAGIVLLFNGKNASEGLGGDPNIPVGAYSAGQALFSLEDPARLVSRSEVCFLTPQQAYEKMGQYGDGTVFIEGLVPFKGKWFLYYGAADSVIGVAVSDSLRD